MNARFVGCALLCLATLVGPTRTAEPTVFLQPPAMSDDADEAVGKDKPKVPDKDKKLTEPPKTDIFAQAPVMGSQFPTGFNPHMMGDFFGSYVRRNMTFVGTQTTTTTVVEAESMTVTTTTVTTPFAQSRTVLVPMSSLGAFKIAENESPRPQNRAFFTWNYFGNICSPDAASNARLLSAQTSVADVPGATVTTEVQTDIPGATCVNLHREVFGFEKTFLDGFASIELRLPLLQQSSNTAGFSSRDVGDLTIIGKYALVLDDSGNVLSAGLGITAPTGPGIDTIDGNLHSTLLQPWFGYIRNFDRSFVQGFHSVVCPTDPRDVTILFNDVSVNWWLFRAQDDRPLRSIVPSFEVHVTTPLNHRDGNGLVYVPDLVVLTGGVHFGLFDNSTLSFAVATPVTGPRPFNIEAFMQLNWRF